jgi:hypothetical protein
MMEDPRRLRAPGRRLAADHGPTTGARLAAGGRAWLDIAKPDEDFYEAGSATSPRRCCCTAPTIRDRARQLDRVVRELPRAMFLTISGPATRRTANAGERRSH